MDPDTDVYTYTIENDDPVPLPQFGFDGTTDSDDEGGWVYVTVEKKSGPNLSRSVTFYLTRSGTADTSDFTASSMDTSITFNTWETRKTFSFYVRRDSTYEPDETVILTLSSGNTGTATVDPDTDVYTYWFYASAIFRYEPASQIFSILSGVIGGAMLLVGMALRRRMAGRWSRTASVLAVILLLGAVALFASAWAGSREFHYAFRVSGRWLGWWDGLDSLSDQISYAWMWVLQGLGIMVICGTVLLLGYLPMKLLRQPGPGWTGAVAVCSIALAAVMAGHVLAGALGAYFHASFSTAFLLFNASLASALILLGCLLGAAERKPENWRLLAWLQRALPGALLVTVVFMLSLMLALLLGTFVIYSVDSLLGGHFVAGVAIAVPVAAFAFALMAYFACRGRFGNAAGRVLNGNSTLRRGLWIALGAWGVAAIMLSLPFVLESYPNPAYPFLDGDRGYLYLEGSSFVLVPRAEYIFAALASAVGVAVIAVVALPALIALKIRRGCAWAWVLRPYWAAAPVAITLVAIAPLAGASVLGSRLDNTVRIEPPAPHPGFATNLPPSILLNDPPPPIHTGGEPYPHGTFPPELEPLWENATEDLQQPDAYWSNVAVACSRTITDYGYVKNQWIFAYEEELEDPLAAISAELRAAGVEHESITVRTRAHYDERYDPTTFINWLSPGNDQFDQFAALERLGGELNPEGSNESYLADPSSIAHHSMPFHYQVKLHGIPEGDSDDVSALPNAEAIELEDPCLVDPSRSGLLLRWLVGGLYTTFGDDLVLSIEPRN